MGNVPVKKIIHDDKDYVSRLKNSVVYDLVKSKAFRRLKGISFLGAIDPWLKSLKVDSSLKSDRYHHSIGVFSIASKIIELDESFPQEEINLFLVTSLLHDLGHGPLSHSVEAVFDKKFGINHHIKTNELILDSTNEINRIIRSLNVNVHDVVGVLNRQVHPYFSKYMNGHFNVDTLDGIFRCYNLLNITPEYSLNTVINASLLNYSIEKNERVLDRFWDMKSKIYNLVIYNGYGRIADEVATKAVNKCQDELSPDLFEVNDTAFYKIFPRIKEEIIFGVSEAINGYYLNHMERTRPRDFSIKQKCRAESLANLKHRYVQKKGDWTEPSIKIVNKEDEQIGLI